ncbi:HK97 family phage prohead protease [Roseivivax sp. GX 12232]|uniref:HK97 family phage prohead protease n=1 Tax=Roseivivax sp. GX 12232 TaxID=2900547 RepID=UPI001E594E44|nr:HK97 family phage prohead protease [Roseivivax sp. GX 12232]MCE0504372.1 HK97 family phage prohead protease [Roseivivax sp. GX 12232]
MELEHKLCRFEAPVTVGEGLELAGYASRFGACDQGGDVVAPGAYAASLKRLAQEGRAVRMLWQHDPAQPIGVWSEVAEDATGLRVKGRLLRGVARAEEAAELVRAGAIDGLSIGYRTLRATKNDRGQRVLTELELWEVSLVTFPMLPSARVAGKGDSPGAAAWRELAETLRRLRREMAGDSAAPGQKGAKG